MKGRRYPLGIQTFKNIIEGNYVYVDKTDLIYELVHEKKYCFLSRPRRFGKSLLVTTLQAYFEGKKELFKGLKLEALEKDWEKHPVIHLDLSKGKYYNMESLIETLDKILETYEDLYQITSVSTEAFNVRLIRIINAAKQKTDRNVVVLIDEYDAPMHDSMKDKDLQDKIRDIMRNFFSPLKSEEDNLLELKYKKDAEAAMEQIDSKDYLAAFADDSRKKYKVGINFSEDRRSIDDWKVEALA